MVIGGYWRMNLDPDWRERKRVLRKCWEDYYEKMGLAHNKKQTKVEMRVRKGKFPPN